jgi:16S rRNA processing protein RimM
LDEYYLIAKIQSAGKNGFVKVQLIPGLFNNLSKIKYLFLDFWSHKKKFELEDLLNSKNSIYLKFKNFDDERDTSVLLDREVFIPQSDFENLELNDILEKDVVEFTVYQNNEVLGVVVDFFETPANTVIEIKNSLGKNILVPFVKDLFENIDYKKKELVLKPDFSVDDDES